LQKKSAEDLKKIKMALETDLNLGLEELYLPQDQNLELKRSENKRSKMTLEDLEKKVQECKKCPLYKTRTNYVLGEGNPRARLMFIGEAPGRDEDLQGRPFVGRAGKLLTKIIEAMGLKREDVYIGNILKDRPPNNRNPQEDEIKACIPYLKEQIEIIQPKVICALGTFAAQRLLEMETPISRLRGKFYLYEGIKFMPTYHPAYLLRNPKEKKAVWEDMQLIMQELGLKVK
jgi:DNA polymerase